MDLIGPLPASYDRSELRKPKDKREGYVYILVMVDASSGWCELVPLKDASIPSIAYAFIANWFCRYGLPRAFMSDRGAEFLNAVVETVLRILRVRRLLTSGYRPQTNGKVERLNDYINQQL